MRLTGLDHRSPVRRRHGVRGARDRGHERRRWLHWQVVGLGTAGKTASQDVLNTSGANNHAGDPATNGVAKVQVAVVELTGGARVARKHAPEPSCKQLGGDGRLHNLNVGKHKTCKPTKFLTARGTTSWKLTLKHSLPTGSYIAIAEAFDTRGLEATTTKAFRVH